MFDWIKKLYQKYKCYKKKKDAIKTLIYNVRFIDGLKAGKARVGIAFYSNEHKTWMMHCVLKPWERIDHFLASMYSCNKTLKNIHHRIVLLVVYDNISDIEMVDRLENALKSGKGDDYLISVDVNCHKYMEGKINGKTKDGKQNTTN